MPRLLPSRWSRGWATAPFAGGNGHGTATYDNVVDEEISF